MGIVAVSEDDVRHVADLARLGLAPDRIEGLVRELNGILAHMEILQAVDTSGVGGGHDSRRTSLPLRADEGPQLALFRAREDFAPQMRHGFFLVPRLATHEDSDVEDAEDAP
jgi:aspartyl-tRNA(Asn)/glutamyl-tRNA(Gln) amidotransferase subunit C